MNVFQDLPWMSAFLNHFTLHNWCRPFGSKKPNWCFDAFKVFASHRRRILHELKDLFAFYLSNYCTDIKKKIVQRRRSRESINLPHVMLESYSASWNFMQDCRALLSQLRCFYKREQNKMWTYMCVIHWKNKRTLKHMHTPNHNKGHWSLWPHKAYLIFKKHTKPLRAFEASHHPLALCSYRHITYTSPDCVTFSLSEQLQLRKASLT